MVLMKLIGVLEKRTIISWFIVVVLAVYIFAISSLTFPKAEVSGLGINAILYHIFVFFLFGFFLMLALVRGKKLRFFLLAVVLSVVYAISDEFHQFFVVGRSSSVGDVLLDSVGISFAFIIYFISVKWRDKKN